ncbi:MAG: response regulator transcription factor [Frankia sp.]
MDTSITRGAAGPVPADGYHDAVPDERAVRVVIADDTDSVRDLVCLLLDLEPDFTVVGQARNGAEAVDVVAEAHPDLVLLDVVMPVLDGISALPRVRAAAPGARVVVFTGSIEGSMEREVVALGADALVDKGLVNGPFVARLREVCHRPPRPIAASV